MTAETCFDRETHKPRLLSEQCATCIFRPGNPMNLRPGRLRQMTNDALREGTQGVICLAGETRVITSSGTLPMKDLAGSEHELLTSGGKWAKAPVRSFGRQRLARIDMSRSGVKKAVYATDGHRWLLRTHSINGARFASRRPVEVTTAGLRPGDRLAWGFPERPEGRTVDPVAVARGFVFGDGTLSRSGRRSFANFFSPKDEALWPYFEDIGNAPRTYGSMTRITGLPGFWKVELPSLSEQAAYLYGWLAGYFAADGDVGKSGAPTISCASRQTLLALRDICNLVGVGTYGIRERTRLGYGKQPSSIFVMGLMRGDLDAAFFIIPAHRQRFELGCNVVEKRGWTVRGVTPTGRTEEVYCAVVPGTSAFALEDHILTGNCHDTLSYGANPDFGGALCRGFYDKFGWRNNFIRIMERLGGFTEVDPPALLSKPGTTSQEG